MARKPKNINLVCRGMDGGMFVITISRPREEGVASMRESFVFSLFKNICFARLDDGEFARRFALTSEPASLVAMDSPVDVMTFARLLNPRALSTLALSTYASCARIEPACTVFRSNSYPLFVAIPTEDVPEFSSRFEEFSIELDSTVYPELSTFTTPSALAIPCPDIYQRLISGGFGDSAKVAFKL